MSEQRETCNAGNDPQTTHVIEQLDNGRFRIIRYPGKFVVCECWSHEAASILAAALDLYSMNLALISRDPQRIMEVCQAAGFDAPNARVVTVVVDRY